MKNHPQSCRSYDPRSSDLRPAKIPSRIDHSTGDDPQDDVDLDISAGESSKIPTPSGEDSAAIHELDDDLDPDELPEELHIEDEDTEASPTRMPHQKEEDDGAFPDQDEV